jgi:tRNA(Leu) C34 or U34 (ribose-2'-O)-methylase TrmL
MIEAPRRLRRAEAVLQRRTSRLILVLERPTDNHNVQAVLRTAEAFGIQHIWYVETEGDLAVQISRSITKGSNLWLSLRSFKNPKDCIEALKKEKFEIWATALDKTSEALESAKTLLPFPSRVALVMGRESDGISSEMREAADRLFYLPMHGFTESFNLSVATALMVQRCFDACPELSGDFPEDEKKELRENWYIKLASSREAKMFFPKFIQNPPEPLEDHRPEEEFRRPRIPKKLKKRLGMTDDED